MHIKSVCLQGVATIEIARPEKKNALSQAMYRAMTETILDAGADESVRALLITGQPGIFTAGNDLEDFMRTPEIGADSPVAGFMQALLNCDKPVVAAVTGAAVGIGVTMLLHCDLVYLSDHAQLLLPFVNLGLVPEFGSSLLLPRLMGHARAAQALLLGEPIGAAEAVAVGLASAVLPSSDLLAHARRMAERFNALPPGAVRDSKRLLRGATRAAVECAIQEESAVLRRDCAVPRRAKRCRLSCRNASRISHPLDERAQNTGGADPVRDGGVAWHRPGDREAGSTRRSAYRPGRQECGTESQASRHAAECRCRDRGRRGRGAHRAD
jgi:enoyl-CoA hydratase/carnithine racemase